MNTRVRASAGCLGSGILSRAETPRCGGVFTGTGYAVDATYTTSCAPPPMMEDLGLGSVAIARPASL